MTPSTTAEDTPVPVNVLANDSDADGDPLTVSAVTPGAHGGVAVVGGGIVIYSPDPDYHGADAFTYTIDDGHGGTDTATVSVTVTPVNDPPVAHNDAYSTPSDLPLAIAAPGVLANDTDADGDALERRSSFSPPASGVLSSNAGRLVHLHGGFRLHRGRDVRLRRERREPDLEPGHGDDHGVGAGDEDRRQPRPGAGRDGVLHGLPQGPVGRRRIVSFLGLGTAGQQGVYSCLTAIPDGPVRTRRGPRRPPFPAAPGPSPGSRRSRAPGP